MVNGKKPLYYRLSGLLFPIRELEYVKTMLNVVITQVPFSF